MEITKAKLDELIAEVSTYKEIELLDIPSIDLYMDQITTFFDDRLGHLKRNEKDPILTKTMINNYTKEKVLMPPTKKKYTKNHIILLLLIYNLKQSLSINDIQALLSPLITEIDKKDFDLDELYSSFLEIKREDITKVKEMFDERLEAIKEKAEGINSRIENEQELILIVLMLINQANMQKRLAEKIIDSFFKK